MTHNTFLREIWHGSYHHNNKVWDNKWNKLEPIILFHASNWKTESKTKIDINKINN